MPVAVGRGRLDEEDVAADAGDGEARRHAWHRGARGDLVVELGLAEELAHALGRDRHGRRQLVRRDLRRDLARDLAELALEVADARLAGVVGDHLHDRGVVDGDLVGLEAGLLDLALEQVVARDRDLLLFGVAVEADQLHAVEQRRGDRLRHVGGRDEQHLGEVEVDLEVVVAERVVLRRVEHLEQRRRRVAPPVAADLVDLVEHDHRVLGAGLLQGAHDAARQRADVGAAVAADVRLVADAAQRDAGELAAERARDGLAERGLADAGRSDQGDDRARSAAAEHLEAALLAQLAHGEELDDAVLHVGQTGVVLVQDSARLDQVVVVLGAHVPGDVEHPVEVGADPSVLGVLLARPLQAVELAVDLGQHVLGHLGLGDPLAVGRDDVGLALVQLLLDRLELLAQQELALGLLHALGDVAADLLLQRGVGEDAASSSR